MDFFEKIKKEIDTDLKLDRIELLEKQLMLPDGTTDQKFFMDDIHLSQSAMPYILQEFSDLL